MKKWLVISVLGCLLFSGGGTALAFPIEYDGDIRFQLRQYKDDIATSTVKGNSINLQQARIRLNFAGNIEQEVSLFGRFSGSTFFGQSATSNNQGALDHYGAKITSNGWTYKLGRQAVNLGQGAIICTGTEAVGSDNKFDGLIASGKIGRVDTNFVIGKTNNALAGNPSSWIGLDISSKLSDNFTLGGAYASEKITDSAASIPARKYWAVNATFSPSPSFTLNSEYVSSRTSGLNPYNKGYFIAATYSWNKDSFSVQYNNVGINAVDGANSGIGGCLYPYNGVGLVYTTNASNVPLPGQDTKYSGFTYTYNHQMSKNASFAITYMDLKVDAASGHDKELAVGFNWKF